MRLRPLDVVTILFALIATAAFSMVAYTGGEKNPNVIIEAGTVDCLSAQQDLHPHQRKIGRQSALVPVEVFAENAGRDAGRAHEIPAGFLPDA